MNILISIESLNCGGAEKSLINFLELLKKKHTITLVMHKKEGDFFNDISKDIKVITYDIDVKIINRINYFIKRKLYKNTHCAQLFWSSHKKNIPVLDDNYDVAIGWGQGFATYYVAEKVLAKKKIAWINVDYEKAGYVASLDRDIYNNFENVIGVSEYVCKKTSHLIGKEMTVIEDIINPNMLIKQSNEIKITFNPKIINIVTVARLAQPKGIDIALETAYLLKEKGYRFKWFFIGDGPERANLEQLSQRLDLNDFIELKGFCSNPYAYIDACDIYCQPSRFEGMGLSLIEAAILKKPIVTTNFPTASHIVTNDQTAIICEMDPTSVSESLEKLINSNVLRNLLSDNLKEVNYSNVEDILKKVNSILL